MSLFHRIRTRLAFAFLLVALIPALVVGIYSLKVSSDTLLEREYGAQAQEVTALKQKIESFLDSAMGDVLFLSRSQPMHRLLKLRTAEVDPVQMEAAKKELEEEFLAFSMQRKTYYQIRYLDETGQEIARVDSNGSDFSVIPQEKLQNKAGRYYFADAVDLPANQVFVSPLDLNRERGKVEVPHKPVIRYAVPVKFPNGDNAGVVLTNVDAKQFLKLAENRLLVDENGFYLSNPDIAKTWGSKRDLDTGDNLKKDFPAIADNLLRDGAGSHQSTESAMTYRPISVPGTQRHWVVISQSSLEDLLASVVAFRITFAEILAVALFLALLLAWYLDRRITKPIEYLTEQANKVSMGELLSPVTVQDKGEIGQLSEAFERMRVSMIKAMERRRRKS